MSKIETEIKLPIKNIGATLIKVRGVADFVKTVYIRDTIFGNGGPKKIRLREQDNFRDVRVIAEYKNRLTGNKRVKVELEETLYDGWVKEAALEAIKREGGYKEENSYEKVRAIYTTDGVEIVLDIYPFGVWLEIEGKERRIWEIAHCLGYSEQDAITKNADELYIDWQRERGLNELWQVKFGL